MPVMFIVAIIPSIVCIATSGYMAINGMAGWGWFLFVGMCLGGFSFNSEGGK